jgi:hypothetical protein
MEYVAIKFGGRAARSMAISTGLLSVYTNVVHEVRDVLPDSWHPSPC